MHPQLERCYEIAIKGAWHQPFFLIPLGHCEWHEGDPKLTKTMQVAPIVKDGKPEIHLYINTEWVKGLPDDEIFGVLCHEIMHPMLRHHERDGGKKRDLWAQAADMAINAALVTSGIKIPAVGLLPPREHYESSAEEIYCALDDGEIEPPQGFDPDQVGAGCMPDKNTQGQEKGSEGQDPGEGGGAPGEGQGDDPGEGEGDGEGDGQGQGDKPSQSQGQGGGAGDDRAWGEMIIQAQTMSRGTGTAKVMGRLFKPAEIKTKWERLLKRCASQAIARGGRDVQTFQRVNRRSVDVILPGWQSNRPAICAIIDTSGSVSDEMLRASLTSVKECARVSGVRIFLALHDGVCYYADWVKAETTVENLSKLCNARGGTDPREAFEKVGAARGKFDACVYLTDGEVGEYPDKPRNVKRMIVGVVGKVSPYRAKIPQGWQEIAVEVDSLPSVAGYND